MYLEFKSFSFIFKWAPDNSSKVLDSITGDRRSRDESRRQLPEQAAFHGVSFLSLTLAVYDSTHLHHPASFSRCLSLLLSPSSNCMSNQCSPVQSSTKLSRHFQPLLSLSFSPFFLYIYCGSPYHLLLPSGVALLTSIPPLSLSTHGHSCFPSLQFSSSSAVLPQQICLLRPFSADRDNSSFFSPRNLFQPPHLLVCFRPSSH